MSFYAKAERYFWQIVITLLGESNVIRKGVQQGAGLAGKYKKAPLQFKIILWALAGWVVGAALGLIGALII